MTIGSNIKHLRLFRGFSQRTLAARLDKSINTIANWEKDLSSPDLKTLEDLCKVLDVTPNELLGWEVNPEYANYVIELENSRQIIAGLRHQYDEIGSQLDEFNKKYGKLL